MSEQVAKITVVLHSKTAAQHLGVALPVGQNHTWGLLGFQSSVRELSRGGMPVKVAKADIDEIANHCCSAAR